uniref:Uncharacterized protein n=1 Tax=Myoviridae sp. ct6eX13 TaxID=2827660 RepID=A0A8S5T5F7_9CAUD|nr:MAG TPA: hypothetical protein [Myoviridae sp. ct6eX13]DAO94542.1 MAG TPA: hypothetical protein [Caudoviricetes sp.]
MRRKSPGPLPSGMYCCAAPCLLLRKNLLERSCQLWA